MNSFDELASKRERFVESSRENGFEEGINKLLIELYPDNAHFIYELLQNAEDAEANEVSFELHKDKLILIHNGRAFDMKDLEGITSIGQGTKANDINKIGKFGVGFKAVFSYTISPQIYSGEYSFEIVDLVVPKRITDINKEFDKTVMVFLNNQNKSKQEAFQEIKKGLEDIEDNTLLFLNSIKTIKYRYNNTFNKIAREKIDEIRVVIQNSLTNQYSKWLIFRQYLPNSTKLFVSIAFKLDVDIKSKEEIIVPINGEVSIYFPAQKETSKLKFHIHAPFASTVARDSIKDNMEENRELRDLISNLLCDSLYNIREDNLLNFNFLQSLPINDDYLSSFYEPIRGDLVEYFNRNNFILTDNGEFRPASQCYRASKKIKELVDLEMLRAIESKNQIYWIKNPSQLNSREDKFLKSLEIIDFNDIYFLEKLDCYHISNKSDIWFGEFYSYLYENKRYDNRLKKFIKLSDNELNLYSKSCYFSDIISDDFLVAKKETYTTNKSEIVNKNAKLFLEYLGVKEIGEKEKIELILKNRYNNDIFPEKKEHLMDIKEFINYYKNNLHNIKFFDKYYYILAIDENNINWWCKAEDIYIDEPFEKTGLKNLNKDIYLLDDIYTRLEISDRELFLEFIKSLGAKNSLEIKKSEAISLHPLFYEMKEEVKNANENRNCISYDYNINNLELLLKEQNRDISLLIWNTLNSSSDNFLIAYYKPNRSSLDTRKDSSLILILKQYKWIPSNDNDYFKPEDISRDMLPDDFIYNNSNSWLTAIGFGEKIRKSQEIYREKEKIIKEVSNFSIDTLEKAKRVGMTDEDIKKAILQKEQTKLQESLAKNQGSGDTQPFIKANNNENTILDRDEYQKNISKENSSNKNSFTQSSTNYKKQNSNEIAKIEEFLYKEYEGHCQICGDTFAYKEKNVFKSKSLNIGKNRDVNRKGNTISLCHKHHSIFDKKLQKNLFYEKIKDREKIDIDYIEANYKRYDWVSKEDIDESNDAFYRLDDRDNFIRDNIYFLPIKLFRKTEYIKFTEAHIVEFIEVWNTN